MAPGYDGVDYSQTILFRDIQYPFRPRPPSKQMPSEVLLNCPGMLSLENYTILKTLSEDVTKKELITSAYLRQDYEVKCWPSALMYTFVFHENWNDMYYMGLDGIELYDYIGKCYCEYMIICFVIFLYVIKLIVITLSFK